MTPDALGPSLDTFIPIQILILILIPSSSSQPTIHLFHRPVSHAIILSTAHAKGADGLTAIM